MLAEMWLLGEKDDIKEEFERLEYASCGRFEEEDRFQVQVRKSREDFEARHTRSRQSADRGRVAKSGAKGWGFAVVNKWILPEKNKSASGALSELN